MPRLRLYSSITLLSIRIAIMTELNRGLSAGDGIRLDLLCN